MDRGSRVAPLPSRDRDVASGVKVCRSCKKEKPVSEFYKTGSGRKGYRADCKTCTSRLGKAKRDTDPEFKAKAAAWSRAARLADPNKAFKSNLRKYRMTLDQYNEILKQQEGACAMCRNLPNGKRLSVDHDHSCCGHNVYKKPACGRCNRGLLCQPCNILLGFVEGRTHLVKEAVKYLEVHTS